MNSNKAIFEKYRNKALAYDVWGDNKDHYIDMFIGLDNLIHIFYELLSGDMSLTKYGVEFIKEYYGKDKILEILREEGGDFESLTNLNDWLDHKFESGMQR